MATVGTITEVSKETDLVSDNLAGTARRRAVFVVRVTTAANSDTLDLSNYDSNISGIEACYGETVDEAAAATRATYSGTTLTFAGHTGSGRTTLRAVVYY